MAVIVVHGPGKSYTDASEPVEFDSREFGCRALEHITLVGPEVEAAGMVGEVQMLGAEEAAAPAGSRGDGPRFEASGADATTRALDATAPTATTAA